jgi:hypothetical protein
MCAHDAGSGTAGLLPRLKAALKRGAILTAANWPVVAVQFGAETTFKLLLATPVLGSLILVALVLGADVGDLLGSHWRELLGLAAAALLSHPVALVGCLFALGVVALGGSALMFTVKGGTVSVLVASQRQTGPIERPPLRVAAFWRASQFSIDRFLDGCARLLQRYLRLGFLLLAVYGISGALFMAALVAAYRVIGEGGLLLEWTVLAASATLMLLAWITGVNLLYLLTQMVIATDDVTVTTALGRVARFLRGRWIDVTAVFGFVLLLVAVATVASIAVTAALGLIAFIPLAGLAVFPLQAIAWLVRGLVFQYVGLSALAAYLGLYDPFAVAAHETKAGDLTSGESSQAVRTA